MLFCAISDSEKIGSKLHFRMITPSFYKKNKVEADGVETEYSEYSIFTKEIKCLRGLVRVDLSH